jgi:secretion/DNA translocation related CpaE-like protein
VSLDDRLVGPPPAGPAATSAARPLLVTADPALLDDLLRLAAAAGAEVEVVADAGSARRPWARAPLVLVGDDLAGPVAAAGPSRRPGVVLVGRDLDDAQVWQRGVAVGAEHVAFLPDAEPWLTERLADAVESGSAAPVVCVVGGRGGAGASTLAAALAVTAGRRSLATVLVDADPLGGGLDLVLGGEDLAGLRWPDLAGARGRVAAAALDAAMPRLEGLSLLSWDRGDLLSVPPEAMAAALAASRRGRDLVVVDLPRRPDPAAEVALAAARTTFLVVPAEVRATAAAARVAALVAPLTADLRVVVRGPAPSGLPGEVVAEVLGCPLAAEVRAEPGVAAALERGDPPAARGRGPLARVSGQLLDDLGLGAGRRRRRAA